MRTPNRWFQKPYLSRHSLFDVPIPCSHFFGRSGIPTTALRHQACFPLVSQASLKFKPFIKPPPKISAWLNVLTQPPITLTVSLPLVACTNLVPHTLQNQQFSVAPDPVILIHDPRLATVAGDASKGGM